MVAFFSLNYLQGLSGIVFGIFLTLHLSNTMAGFFGEKVYDAYQEHVRAWYQNPVGEAVTFISLGVHCVTSTLKYLDRAKKAAAGKSIEQSASKKFHAYTGYLLLLIIIPHLFVTRFDEHSPMFAGLSYVTRNRFFRLMILPYFVLYGAAGIVHMVLGLPSAFKLMGWYKTGNWISNNLPLQVITVMGVIGVELGIAGMMGLVGTTELTSDYTDSPFAVSHAALADKMWDFAGPYLAMVGIPHWRNF